MQDYFMNFHVKGEVAARLLIREPEFKLLVDISPTPAADAKAPGFRYPNRVSFTLECEWLIDRFLDEVKIGEVVEAKGTFIQSNYIPHKTSQIDTTFKMVSFERPHRALKDLNHAGRIYQLPAPAWIN